MTSQPVPGQTAQTYFFYGFQPINLPKESKTNTLVSDNLCVFKYFICSLFYRFCFCYCSKVFNDLLIKEIFCVNIN